MVIGDKEYKDHFEGFAWDDGRSFDAKFADALRRVADWFDSGVLTEGLLYPEKSAPCVTVRFDVNNGLPSAKVEFEAYPIKAEPGNYAAVW